MGPLVPRWLSTLRSLHFIRFKGRLTWAPNTKNADLVAKHREYPAVLSSAVCLEKKLTEFVRKQTVFGSEPVALGIFESLVGSLFESTPPT